MYKYLYVFVDTRNNQWNCLPFLMKNVIKLQIYFFRQTQLAGNDR